MEIWEFDRFLHARFLNVRVEHMKKSAPDALPYTKLACLKCGHTCLVHTRYILDWKAEGKGGLMQFLLRHVVCSGTYGT